MAPVADRVAKQNALFEEYYQAFLKNFPERATSYGDYRYNSQLAQVSLADIARQHAENDDFLARLKAIPIDDMSDKDLLSHRILEKQLERADVNYALKNYEMPVNQQNGVHTQLADLPNAVPFDSVPHYQDYISRLHQIPRVLEQTTEVMEQGEKDGLMPPKFLLERSIAWAGGYVGDGVSTANLAGRTLADLILGRDTDITRLPWVGHLSPRWESEPLRWLGINGGRVLVASLDRAEVAGRNPRRREKLAARLFGT